MNLASAPQSPLGSNDGQLGHWNLHLKIGDLPRGGKVGVNSPALAAPGTASREQPPHYHVFRNGHHNQVAKALIFWPSFSWYTIHTYFSTSESSISPTRRGRNSRRRRRRRKKYAMIEGKIKQQENQDPSSTASAYVTPHQMSSRLTFRKFLPVSPSGHQQAFIGKGS